jgi:hypothetical protein
MRRILVMSVREHVDHGDRIRGEDFVLQCIHLVRFRVEYFSLRSIILYILVLPMPRAHCYQFFYPTVSFPLKAVSYMYPSQI